MITVRIANKYDAEDIAKLGNITFSQSFGHLFSDEDDLLNYLEKTFSVDKIKNSFKDPNNVFFIAFDNNLAIGYAKLKLNSKSAFIQSENVCQLQKIYILKDHLSKKIGLELQKLLLEKAKLDNFDIIWLSVYKENTKAIRFYKKNNFIPIGVHNYNIGKEKFEFDVMFKLLKP